MPNLKDYKLYKVNFSCTSYCLARDLAEARIIAAQELLEHPDETSSVLEVTKDIYSELLANNALEGWTPDSLIWLPLSLVFNDFDIELEEAAIRSSYNLDIKW